MICFRSLILTALLLASTNGLAQDSAPRREPNRSPGFSDTFLVPDLTLRERTEAFLHDITRGSSTRGGIPLTHAGTIFDPLLRRAPAGQVRELLDFIKREHGNYESRGLLPDGLDSQTGQLAGLEMVQRLFEESSLVRNRALAVEYLVWNLENGNGTAANRFLGHFNRTHPQGLTANERTQARRAIDAFNGQNRFLTDLLQNQNAVSAPSAALFQRTNARIKAFLREHPGSFRAESIPRNAFGNVSDGEFQQLSTFVLFLRSRATSDSFETSVLNLNFDSVLSVADLTRKYGRYLTDLNDLMTLGATFPSPAAPTAPPPPAQGGRVR